MGKRIWASLDDFVPPLSGQPFLGRTMANFYFFSALMKYGTFDEYHFFLSNAAHCTMFLKYHAPIFEVLGVQERVRVFDRLRIQEAVTKHDYTVFHQSDHITLFNKLCRFRNSIGAGFPVTGFIHSISYQQYMASYLEMLEIGATPGDALICSSGSGKQVLESCFDRLAANLAVATNRLQMPVVPLGIDEDGEVPLKETARDHLKLSRDEVIALVFGRFSDVDKMDIFPLIQAFQQAVGHDEVRWRLVLAGSVHSRVYLKMLEVWIDALGVKDRVTILTEPTETEKQHLYGAADFFVSLSDNPH
jgi:glycosyltransferase involved in cell wall biosynthesis